MKSKLCFIFYCLFICLIILLADLGRLPLNWLGYIPYYDKVGHLVLYGVFYALLKGFLQGKRVFLIKRSFSLSFLLTSVLMIGEEVSQIFLASRTFSLVDLFMGFAGVFLVRIFYMSYFSAGHQTSVSNSLIRAIMES